MLEQVDFQPYYCGMCKQKYHPGSTHDVPGEQGDIPYQDRPTVIKETIQIILIQCPHHHTIGARIEETMEEYFPF